MNFIIWLIVGGLIGYVASMVMKRPEGMIMNVIVGIVGSMLGGWLISPLLGAGHHQSERLQHHGLARLVPRRRDPAGHRELLYPRPHPHLIVSNLGSFHATSTYFFRWRHRLPLPLQAAAR